MKKAFIAISLAATMMSCDKMNDTHQQYLDKGEQIYAARVDSMFLVAGNSKARVDMYYAAQRISRGTLTYSFKGEETDIEVDFEGQRKYTYKMLEDLPEGSFTFTLITEDTYGNKGLPTEVTGKVYGPDFIKSLPPMVINSKLNSNGTAHDESSVKWSTIYDCYNIKFDGLAADATLMKITYKSTDGTEKTIETSVFEDCRMPKDVELASEFSYQTGFKPAKKMLETLYSPVILKAKFPKK